MKAAILNRIYFALSLIGIFVSGVLSIGKYFQLVVPCGVRNECAIVESHASSVWFGVPVAYIGLAAYLFFAAIAVLRMHYKLPRIFIVGPFFINLVGAAIHVGLAVYASSVINATCIWCLSSMTTMVAMFFVAALLAQADEIQTNPKLDLIITVPLAIVMLGALGMTGNYILNGSGQLVMSKALEAKIEKSEMVTNPAHIMGNPAAPITIVEFADLFCPGCRASFPKVKAVVTQSNDKIRWVFHHMPLYKNKGHEFAWQAAMLSEYAAEKGKFWQFVDTIYGTQPESITSIDNLYDIITTLGLDAEAVKPRMEGKEDPLFKKVYADYLLANNLGIEMTPTLLVKAEGIPWQVTDTKGLETILQTKQFRDIINKK